MTPAQPEADILLVTHHWERPCYERSMVEALSGVDGRVEVVIPERGEVISDIHRFKAVVYFIRFSELTRWEPIDWAGYEGLRVMLDTDAFMDYCWWFGASPEQGQWEPTIRRHQFDMLMCTGRSAAESFQERGQLTTYLNKGFDPKYFFDMGHSASRDGVMHYGMPYRSRRSMLHRVRAAGTRVQDINVDYSELNGALNRHAAVLICNMTSTVRLGALGKVAERLRPGSALNLETAPEPMVKNFESLASGTCVFMDRFPESDELGFVDGENCVTYADFDELNDKLRHFLSRPDEMADIGRAGAELARERHTWEHRSVRFRELIDETSSS